MALADTGAFPSRDSGAETGGAAGLEKGLEGYRTIARDAVSAEVAAVIVAEVEDESSQ